MQLPPQLKSDRKQFLFEYFLKFPTKSIRSGQKALRESPFGPQMMRTLKIAEIRTAARRHLDELPVTAANADAKMDLMTEKLANDIERDLYRDLPYPETARQLGGFLDVVTPVDPVAAEQLKQQFKASVGAP